MPHSGDVLPQTLEALKAFPTEWNGIEFSGEQLHNFNPIKARNDLLWGGTGLEEFDDQFDSYLFWDSDVVGTIEDFAMMYALNKPVVMGLYPYAKGRGFEGEFVGGTYFKGYPGCTGDGLRIPLNEKGIFESNDYWGGFGFCLIQKWVLKKIEYPWVEPRVVKAPPNYPRKFENVYDDIGFCLKLAENGITPVIDSRVNLKHLPRNQQINMDKEAVACIGIITQMAERIKML